MKRIWLSADSYDEVWDEIIEHAEEVLDAFLSSKQYSIIIEYGKCKAYSRDGYDVDYDCVAVGEFELDWEEFLDTFGHYELLDLLKEINNV